MAQEALSNAVRHGQAKEIFVKLHADKGLVRMDIRDTGKGFDSGARCSGLGLVSMEERLRMIGGDLKVMTRLGEGTQVSALLRAPENCAGRKCRMGSGACWPSTSRNPVGEVICVRDFKRKLRGSQRGAAAISAVASAVRWADEIIKGD